MASKAGYSPAYVQHIIVSPIQDPPNALVTLAQIDGTKIGDFLISTKTGAQANLITSLCIACASFSALEIWTDGDMTGGFDHIVGVGLTWAK